METTFSTARPDSAALVHALASLMQQLSPHEAGHHAAGGTRAEPPADSKAVLRAMGIAAMRDGQQHDAVEATELLCG